MRIPVRLRRGDPLVCREFVELVTDYLDDALPARERRRMEAHLAACDGCDGYLEDFRLIVRTLGDTPPPPPDPQTRQTLLQAFRELRAS
jgi:anti-sigma factor RsiW